MGNLDEGGSMKDSTGPELCRCDRKFVVKKIKLEDDRVVRNYWCRVCDTIDEGRTKT